MSALKVLAAIGVGLGAAVAIAYVATRPPSGSSPPGGGGGGGVPPTPTLVFALNSQTGSVVVQGDYGTEIVLQASGATPNGKLYLALGNDPTRMFVFPGVDAFLSTADAFGGLSYPTCVGQLNSSWFQTADCNNVYLGNPFYLALYDPTAKALSNIIVVNWGPVTTTDVNAACAPLEQGTGAYICPDGTSFCNNEHGCLVGG